MASLVWKDCTLWLGQYDFSSYTTDLSVDLEVDEVEVTTHASQGVREYKGGLKKSMAKGVTFADSVTSGTETAIASLLGTEGVLFTASVDGTAGARTATTRGFVQSYTFGGKVGDMAHMDFQHTGANNEGVLHGTLMYPKTTTITSTSSTAIQLGAVGAAQKVYGALHVFGASGAGTGLVVKLQSAASAGGSYTDQVTFTSTASTTYELKSTAGAITDTYWRVKVLVAGSSPSFSFAVAAAIQ